MPQRFPAGETSKTELMHLYTTPAQAPPSDELRADLERLEVLRQSAERGLAP